MLYGKFKVDDAVFKVTLIQEHGNYRFEVLDFQYPETWQGITGPFGEVLRRDCHDDFIAVMYLQVAGGGNQMYGYPGKCLEIRENAVKEAKNLLLDDEIKRLHDQMQKADELRNKIYHGEA